MNIKKFIFFSIFIIVGLYFFLSSQSINSGHYTASSEASVNYCLAIRGNGELEPAHWGATAHLIEQLGLPTAMAGGSSATITMFLLNALAQNPFIKDQNLQSQEKNQRAALLVKSFLGFFNELKNTKFAQDIFNFYGEYNSQKAEVMTQDMLKNFALRNISSVMNVLRQGIQLGLFDEESLNPLITALKNKNNQRAQFYLQQLSESVSQFGKFDATKDANLFFRPGLISFKNASVSFGRWAGFYAAQTTNPDILNSWSAFFDECGAASDRKSWADLLQFKPQCKELFHFIFETYFNKNLEPESHLENQDIGYPIPVYPSTSVLVGTAALQVEKAFIDYNQNLDPEFGFKFKIKNPEEVRFGYWGEAMALTQIEQRLDKTDEKNRRFLALGKTTWKQVLSLSPAEPGLSPFIPFSSGEQKFISAGGWADLHPVNVLKASGCQNVVYVTREGGESLFGQGVANRLMNLNKDILKITPEINITGDPSADPQSNWSRLFNMANPKSSLNFAISQATAVVCTNWDAYDVKTDLLQLIDNAYRSPYWLSQVGSAQSVLKLSPLLQEKRPGCQPLE